MLGKRVAQMEQLEVDHPYLDFVGRDSFYGFLAARRGQLFRDEDFATLYCADNGRPDVFTARWAEVGAERAIVEPTLYYAETAVTFGIVFGPFPDRWRIVAVEPRPAPPASRP